MTPPVEPGFSGPVDARTIVQLRVARAVDDFQRGVNSEASFALIYTTYALVLEQLFRGRGLEAEACRDHAEETLLEVHRRLTDFDSHTRFETWLYGIAVAYLPTPASDHEDETEQTEAHFAYLNGELTPHDAVQIRERLEGCPDTRKRLRELERLADASPPEDEDVAAAIAQDLARFNARLRVADVPEPDFNLGVRVLGGVLVLVLLLLVAWLVW